jgi:hypothetical protein
LLVEIVAGALGYALAAVVVARRHSVELLTRLRDALRPRAVS